MEPNIIMNNYIKADVVSDILSQTIYATRKKIEKDDTKELRELLDKLLKYDEEVKKGNVEVMDKILNGEV